MVPAVLADLNSDSVMDVVAMTFDGVIAAFDGVTLSEIWNTSLPGTETYT